ncbi:MAG: T9SS type A sorting domain-containing protein [Bacteroidota bacterium]
MKKTKKHFLIFIFLFCVVSAFRAQQGMVASGGDDIGVGGYMSLSVGQIDYLTVTGSGEVFTTEGLQQPYEILTIEETENNAIISVYPNLSSDFVFLSILNMNIENMTYALYDVQGKLIEKQKVVVNQTSISLIDFANAIYLIRVFNNDNEVKSFKIIKN